MLVRNDNSSLVALRELREMEKRRLHEEEQVRAKTDKERRDREQAQVRAEQERLARENAEREAAQARETAESARLRRELDSAHSEIAHLRDLLVAASIARAQAASPAPLPPVVVPVRARPTRWMAASACATILAGTLAISATMRPKDSPAPLVELPTKSSAACPGISLSDPPVPRKTATAAPEIIASSPPKVGAKARALPLAHPRGNAKPPSAKPCDGTDPLCGIDIGALDDVGKNRRKVEKKIPR
jgi:hypothetical protein